MKNQWSNQISFLIAAIATAVGLGNVWRFPYIAAQNGGGAFLIPYLVAMFSAGIPILLLEYWLGSYFKKPGPSALGKIKPIFKILGWFALAGVFIVLIYYAYAISWILVYILYSFSISEWATTISDSSNFFYKNVINISEGPYKSTGFHFLPALMVIVLWTSIGVIVGKSMKLFEKIVVASMPIALVCLIILLVRGVSLQGAGEGLSHFLSVDFSKLSNLDTWSAAYTQIFFSLSIAMGALATLSYMNNNSKMNLVSSSIITAFGNAFYSFLCGLIIFSILGYYIYSSGDTWTNIEQKLSGPALVFILYPVALAKLPFSGFFAFVFYIAMLTLGLSSVVTILKSIAVPIAQTFNLKERNVTISLSSISGGLSLLFTFGGGLYWLDVLDHYIMNYSLPLVGLLECLIVAYVFGIRRFLDNVYEHSSLKFLKNFFMFTIGILNPIALLVVFINNLNTDIGTAYSGYPLSVQYVLGVGCILFAVFISVYLYLLEKKRKNI